MAQAFILSKEPRQEFRSYIKMNVKTQDNSNEIPLRYQISYKESEKALLKMEDELMQHFKMGRSDLHKYFIRVNYNLLKNPNPFMVI